MTKDEAIQHVINAFDAWESEWETLNDDWSYKHEARDMAIEALKRDDPETEFQKRFEKTTICGYSAKELMLFADACRRNGITSENVREFKLNAETAAQYVTALVKEQLARELTEGMKKQLS